jgi:hypothetical protein
MTLSALAVTLLVAGTPTPKLSPAEQRYVDGRALATAMFGQGPTSEVAERKALADLSAQLQAIIGPVRLTGLGQGSPAFEGFWGLGSLDKADGLIFRWRDDVLFVTTRALYLRFVGLDPRPVDFVSVGATIGGHAAYMPFAEVPVSATAPTRTVRASVGLTAQDIGPWPPDMLVVHLERGDRVYVVGSPLQPRLEQVASCEAKFEAVLKEGRGGSIDSGDVRELAFEAYRSCVAAGWSSRPSFQALRRRAQAIVDQLEAADGAATGR